MGLLDDARSLDTNLRRLPRGGEEGPASDLRLLQGPIQQGENPSYRLWSLPQGSVLDPSDLPQTPPGMFVSSEEIQYLEDEAADIMKELEARNQMKETLLKGSSRENEDNPLQNEMSKRARNKFGFRIMPSLQYWERKGKRNSSPNNVLEKQGTEDQEKEKYEPAVEKRARNKFRFHVPNIRYLSGDMYRKGKRDGSHNFVPMCPCRKEI